MTRREFYLQQGDYYDEADAGVQSIESIYEIIPKSENMIELPTGYRELRLTCDATDVRVEVADVIDTAGKGRLRAGRHCIGIRLGPGVTLCREAIARLEGEENQVLFLHSGPLPPL